MRSALTEFVGTFIFVLTIGLVVTAGSPMAPLAIGLALMVVVYAGGHISGGHYNPAVSIAAVMRGALPASQLAPYIVAQVLGSTAGAFLVCQLVGQSFAPAPGANVTTLSALLVEFFYTFALVYVVLNVAVAKKTQGNSYYGLAIGMTVTAAALAGGAISGGAFNPAVAFGPTLVAVVLGDGNWSNLWLYFVGPITGAVVAALIFGLQERDA